MNLRELCCGNKPISKGCSLHGSIYLTFTEYNYKDGEQISGCQVQGWEQRVDVAVRGQYEGVLLGVVVQISVLIMMVAGSSAYDAVAQSHTCTNKCIVTGFDMNYTYASSCGNIGGGLGKGVKDLLIHFFATSSESIITSK